MTKRQKQVFKGAEVAHIWAAGKQESGRNSARNIFFSGETIYSYGSHFPMATITVAKGQKIALHTTRTYSNTTAKHQAWARYATNHLPSFVVPFIASPEHVDNFVFLQNKIADTVTSIMYGRSGMSTAKKCLLDRIKEYNLYVESFGVKKDRFELPKDFEAELDAVLVVKRKAEKIIDARREVKRKERWAEYERLNKFRAFERKEQDKKEQAELKKARKELPALLDAWEAFKGPLPDYGFKAPIRLRVTLNEVETSHGAAVPLNEAIALLDLIRHDKNVNAGYQVGDFEVVRMDKKILQVGCHKIPMDAVKKLAKQLLNTNAPSNVVQLRKVQS